MGVLGFYVVVCAVLLVLAVITRRWQSSLIYLSLVALAVGLFNALSVPLIGLASAALTIIVAVICGTSKEWRTSRRWTLVASMVLAAGLPGFYVCFTLARRAQLQAEFPFESVAHRLSYEQEAIHRRASAEDNQPPARFPTHIQERLERRENISEYPFGRKFQLSYLHRASTEDFILSQGFGVTRMPIRIGRNRIVLPPAPSISLPPSPYLPESTTHGSSIPLADSASGPLPGQESLLALHDAGADDFLNPNRTGYAQDKDHVAGFMSHTFTKLPAPREPQPQLEAWQVAKLELVSLLKHDEPRVYTSDSLPQMEQLADVPTRPLDAFETRSLQRLRRDDDLVVDETPQRIRMLGALRAGKDCRACHSVDYGELLGAFSYEIVPQVPKAPAKKPADPPPAA